MTRFLLSTAKVIGGTLALAIAYLVLTPRYLPDPIDWPESGPFMAYELSRIVVGLAFGLTVMVIWKVARMVLGSKRQKA